MQLQNWRKSAAFVLLFVLILPILAACGGTAPATDQPAAATTAPVAEATAAPAGEPTATTEAAAEPTATTEAAAEATATPEAAASGSAKPGVLRINVGAEPDNWDPQRASFVGEIQWIMLNYQALMTFDKEMQPVPGQAESVEASADGKTYTFKIRPDSKYSDGSPLTAESFEYAWKRLADPEIAGEYQFIGCGVIEGYSEYAATTCADAEGNTKTITDVQSLDLEALREGVGVNAIDDSTLEIKLVNPAPYFLSMAALWIGAPVRQEDADQGEEWFRDVANFIGNGPFKMTEHEEGSSVTWERNENYQGPLGPVKLQGIEMAMIEDSAVAFQAYKNGELDLSGVAAEDLPAVQGDATLSKEVIEVPGSCAFYLGFNTQIAPFDNLKVRQAFAQAFDREAWVRDVLSGLGTVTYSLIPPGFPGFQEDIKTWEFNADAAKQTLADAGFADGAGLPPIKLTYSSSPRNKVRFEWMANQIKQNLGVDVTLDPIDPTAYTALTKDNPPQMYYLGWCADYPDPQDFLTVVFKTGGIHAGRTGFSDKEFDDLVSQADIEQDVAKRAELYEQAQQRLVDQVPVVFVANDKGLVLAKPYVKGVTQDTITPLDYIPGFFNLPELDVAP
jgi:oligopeptide transport system substrate-binding protein